MRIFRVVMVVMMPMIMVLVLIMMVVMVVVPHMQTALARAKGRAKLAIADSWSGGRGTLPLHVVMMAFLHRPKLAFKAQHLHPVFAKHTSGWHRAVYLWPVFRLYVLVAFALDGQHLFSIGASAAIGHGHIAGLFQHTFGESFEHFRVVVQIARLFPLNVGMRGCDLIGEAIYAVDQDAGEEEIGEHDHAFVAELGDMGQAYSRIRNHNHYKKSE